MVKFKDFSSPLGVFQVLFKASLILRTFEDSPIHSSTFQVRTLIIKVFNVSELIKLYWSGYCLQLQRNTRDDPKVLILA